MNPSRDASPGPESFGGQSMVAPLRRVVVCEPQAAGWADAEGAGAWRQLGYPHPPAAATARAEHGALVARLTEAGVEVVTLAGHEGFTPDAIYPHDPSLLLDDGALILRMGKASRAGEPDRHHAFYTARGIPVAGRLEGPATAEGGDLLWLDPETLLAGRGYRTNAAGIAQLRALLTPRGIAVVEAPLPHGQGPDACLHLMSLVSLLDETTALVDLPWLAVPVVEELDRRGFCLVEIDPAERPTQAANVLSLGAGRLLALAENPRTNRRLADHGFTVLTFPGSEIAHNGGGGPTCLTRPLLRG